ncbi:hypothetical protein YC2023_118847 [Brassica napus]
MSLTELDDGLVRIMAIGAVFSDFVTVSISFNLNFYFFQALGKICCLLSNSFSIKFVSFLLKHGCFEEKQSVENHHHPSRLGRSMEKQQSFRGVATVENHKRGVIMEKLPSFCKAATMERQKSFRGGFLEKQKRFRVVMERQLSFIGERRKKTESPGKRGDSPLHIAARTENLRKVKELIRGGCDGEELRELLSKQNFEGETPLYTVAENGHSAVGEEMLQQSLLFQVVKWSGAFTGIGVEHSRVTESCCFIVLCH